jgi:hypothetical protein
MNAMSKKQHNILPLALSALSFVFIVIGAISVFTVQSPIQNQSQDIRFQASVESGMVEVIASPSNNVAFTPGEPLPIELAADTNGVQVDGIQLVFHITTDAEGVTIGTVQNAGLSSAFQEVETVSDGFLVSMILIPSNVGQTFSSTGATTFIRLSLEDPQTVPVHIVFDEDNSISTVHGSTPPRDELKTMASITYPPATTTAVTPSASPSTSPAASATPGTGGPEVKACNGTCSLNSECGVNQRCYENHCRLATNPTSTTCAAAETSAGVRQCNENCAGNNDCRQGFTCFENKCRRPENPDSATCSTTTAVTAQTIASSCNTSCSSNKECAVNLRCYQGSCRLATNPSSASCSAPNASTISKALYGKKGEEKEDASSTTSASPRATSSSNLTNQGSYTPPQSRTTNDPQSFLQTILSALAERGISLTQIAIGVGLFLLLLTLLSLFMSRSRRGMPPKVVPGRMTSPTNSTYEESLRQKIDSLRQQQAAPVSAPSAPTPPVRPMNFGTPIASSVPNEPVSAPQTPDNSSSSMMQKLRDRGTLEKIPNPTEPSSPPSSGTP